MATLHKTTEFAKKILKLSTIMVVSLIVLFVVFRLGTQIKEYFFPTPLPPPTVKFGKLPSLKLPENADSKTFTYRLNTLSGQLPSLPTQTHVYKIVKPQPSLLALPKAQEKVAKVGFNLSPIRISDTLYQWTNQDTPSKKLLLDITSYTSSLSSDFLFDQDVLSARNLPDENGAIEKAVIFLKNIDFPQDIDTEKTKATLLSLGGQELVPATSFSKTQVIRVDFFQKDVDSLSIYYPNPPNSIIYVLIAAGSSQPQIVEAKFFHHNISEISATYPIKTAEEAFLELKNKKAYIASYLGGETSITIKNISLGYYLEDKEQNYLLPVIVFEGNNGFLAYVKALRDEWIEK